jgi:hypothetical protein
MTTRFLFGIAAAFFVVFAVGVGAVVGIAHYSDQTTISEISSASDADRPVTPPVASIDAHALAPEAAAPSSGGLALAPVSSQPTGIPVTSDDINRLAVAVNLGSENTGDVRREVWAKETPVAEQLLNGMCDCDQRNWLKHFVETGKEAVSGSENYHQSIQTLATLRRGNPDPGHPAGH